MPSLPLPLPTIYTIAHLTLLHDTPRYTQYSASHYSTLFIFGTHRRETADSCLLALLFFIGMLSCGTLAVLIDRCWRKNRNCARFLMISLFCSYIYIVDYRSEFTTGMNCVLSRAKFSRFIDVEALVVCASSNLQVSYHVICSAFPATSARYSISCVMSDQRRWSCTFNYRSKYIQERHSQIPEQSVKATSTQVPLEKPSEHQRP